MIVFSTWMNDRIARFPNNAALLIGGGFIDVLRLGSDLDTSSGWALGKGIFLNVTRLLAVAGPAGRGLTAANRYAGLIATAGVGKLTGVPGPCRFVNLNNVISAVKGKTIQLFVSLDDVVAIRSTAPSGARGFIGELLEHPTVAPLLKQAGVVWTNLGNLRSMDEVMAAVHRYDGAVSIGLQWTNPTGRAMRHRFALVKDHRGEVRFLDYSTGQGFKGFKSLQEIVQARPHWAGLENAVLRPEVVLFQSNYLKFLQGVDGVWHLSVPIAVGFAWARGKSFDQAAFDIAMSIWKFIKARLGDEAPPPPVSDTKPVVPRPPAQGRPPEAANAPRPDWLTGVRYRLSYLAYYNGPIDGPFDRVTKEAVIAFQTDQRIMIDGIPGPQTQGELVSVCGF